MRDSNMQSVMRENASYQRLNDSPLAIEICSHSIGIPPQGVDSVISTPANDSLPTDSDNLVLAGSECPATGEKDGSRPLIVSEQADMLHALVSWVCVYICERCIDRIPGFRLRKLWRFSEQDTTACIQTVRTKHYHHG
jgi:hypothetical protein